MAIAEPDAHFISDEEAAELREKGCCEVPVGNGSVFIGVERDWCASNIFLDYKGLPGFKSITTQGIFAKVM